MMRLKKGSKVEVLNTNGAPGSCSWLPAEIIAGNGRCYTVRYSRGPFDTEANVFGKVPRKVIRPTPPVLCSGSWLPGDIVEMFYGGGWKSVEVSKVVGEGYFLVHEPGDLDTLQVHRINLRARQVWQNNQWRVMGKDDIFEVGSNLECEVPELCRRRKKVSNIGVRKKRPRVTSSHYLKDHEATGQLPTAVHNNANKKRRTSWRDDMCWVMVEGKYLSLPEKVVAISSPKNNLDGNFTVKSHSKRIGHSVKVTDERNPSAGFGCFRGRSLECDRAGCDEQSICSSSGSNSNNLLHNCSLTGRHLDLNEMAGDACSCTKPISDRQNLPLTDEDMTEEIHLLELQAYRSTLEDLYASGPMSWEQEVLMTNLRLVLNISNDEHLSELKHLTSRESKLRLSVKSSSIVHVGCRTQVICPIP